MAGSKKQPTTKKTSATRSTQSSTPRRQTKRKGKPSAQEMRSYKVRYEIKMIALIAVTLFQLLGLYTDAVGVVGAWLTGLYMGTIFILWVLGASGNICDVFCIFES